MGRYFKGERRQFMTRIPPAAGEALMDEVKGLGCNYSDFIVFVVCRHLGVPMEKPTGSRTRYISEARPAPGDRVEFATRVPLELADRITEEAQERGYSYADYIAEIICAYYKIPFAPRVREKALKAWVAQGNARAGMLQATG